jgi:hypothetical protein
MTTSYLMKKAKQLKCLAFCVIVQELDIIPYSSF